MTRIVLDNVKSAFKKKYTNMKIDVDNIEEIRHMILNLDSSEYSTNNVSGKIIKDIVNNKISR